MLKRLAMVSLVLISTVLFMIPFGAIPVMAMSPSFSLPNHSINVEFVRFLEVADSPPIPPRYIEVILSGIGNGFSVQDGKQGVWCCAAYQPFGDGSEAYLYSSLNLASLPTARLQNIKWGKINYILNNHDDYSFLQIQNAIWAITDGDAGNALSDAAQAHGDFTPAPGQVGAVIIYREGDNQPLFTEAIVLGCEPKISLSKSPDKNEVMKGEPITYTFIVTNSGSTLLTDIKVVDNNFTLLCLSDDFIVGTIPSLFPGESATFNITRIPPVDERWKDDDFTLGSTPSLMPDASTTAGIARIPPVDDCWEDDDFTALNVGVATGKYGNKSVWDMAFAKVTIKEVETSGVPNQTKVDLIATLKSLKGSNKEINEKLDKAIMYLQKSVDPKLWVDETHLNIKEGDAVFDYEKYTVKYLLEAKCNKNASSSLKTKLQDAINKLVGVDKLLASTAIGECSGRYLSTAKSYLTKGNNAANSGKYEDAIEYYGKAWEYAVK